MDGDEGATTESPLAAEEDKVDGSDAAADAANGRDLEGVGDEEDDDKEDEAAEEELLLVMEAGVRFGEDEDGALTVVAPLMMLLCEAWPKGLPSLSAMRDDSDSHQGT